MNLEGNGLIGGLSGVFLEWQGEHRGSPLRLNRMIRNFPVGADSHVRPVRGHVSPFPNQLISYGCFNHLEVSHA